MPSAGLSRMSTVESQYGSVIVESKSGEDGEIDPIMHQQEQYCHIRWGSQYPAPSSMLRKAVVKIVLPLLALWCGLLPILLSIPPANSSISIVSGSGSSKANPLLRTSSSNLYSEPQTSPFFEHVLEWFEIPLDEVPTVYDHPGNSNHYRGSIEFCSDPSTNLFGYGPVGKCVPGKPAPVIRIKPKHFYQLTLYNNAHIDTNIHTHGLHVSGVGTVDDVTRVAKPGECLTYDVSWFAKKHENVARKSISHQSIDCRICFISLVLYSRRRGCRNILVSSPSPSTGWSIGLWRSLWNAHCRRISCSGKRSSTEILPRTSSQFFDFQRGPLAVFKHVRQIYIDHRALQYN